MQRLTVKYLFKGAVEDDIREGHRFRWTWTGRGLNVNELDADYRLVWAKTYADPVCAEIVPSEPEPSWSSTAASPQSPG